MTKFAEVSHVQVYLSDVLDALDEERDTVASGILGSTEGEDPLILKHRIGVAHGLKRAIHKLRNTHGAEPINDAIDTRY